MDLAPARESPGYPAYEPAALGCPASRSFQHSRTGNVHSADDWGQLLPETERYQKLSEEGVFRADTTLAKPEVYDALEERGVRYAIRMPANESLERDIGELLTRPVGRRRGV